MIYVSIYLILIYLSPFFQSKAVISQIPGADSSIYYAEAGNRGIYPRATTSRSLSALSSGDSLLVYMRFRRKESVTSSTYTSAFFPRVDDYSQMTVPNSKCKADLNL